MKIKIIMGIFASAMFALLAGNAEMAQAEGKPTIAGGCMKCHEGKADAVRGLLTSVSAGFKTMQVTVGNLIWIINYDDKTAVIQGEKKDSAAEIVNLPLNKEVRVSFAGPVTKPLATEVSVKQPYKVAEEQLIKTDALTKLIEMGPDKGGYTLIDARPGDAFLSGHIPTAKSLPYGAFEKKYAEVLPADKESLIIFYCGGVT